MWGGLAFSLLMQGCSREEEQLIAVWADDGAGIAMYRLTVSCLWGPFPAKPAPCDPERAELQMEDGASSWRLPLDAEEPGGTDLYWMHSQGYVLLQRMDSLVLMDDQTGREQLSWTDMLAGAIPSPDGDVLAFPRLDAKRWWVEVLHASDGQPLLQLEIPLVPSVQRVAPFAHTWTPSGRFVVQTDPDNGRAVSISLDGSTEEIDEPGCWSPQTTSSQYNADGEHALGGDPIDVSETFGCQQ